MQVALLDVLVRMDVRMGRSGALAARLERMKVKRRANWP
jgi:hypothetical protein